MLDRTLLLFLPMILFLGIITSYEDIKQGKIRNKWIMLAFGYAIAVNAAMFIWMRMIGVMPRPEYFIELLIMAALSLLLGFLMWHAGTWTAGDAKLFAAFSALVPLSAYSYGRIPYFSSLNILINTMVPMFLVYVPILLLKTTWKQKLMHLRRAFSPKQLLQTLVFLYAIVWPINLVVQAAGIQLNTFLLMLILILLSYIAQRQGMKLAHIMPVMAVLRMVFDPTAFDISSAGLLLLSLLILAFFRFFMVYCANDVMTTKVKLGNLRPGMVPAERLFVENGKCRAESMDTIPVNGKYLYETKAEGLSSSDISKLRRLKIAALNIYQTMPFAPYLFAGTLLTMVLRGNMFAALAQLF